MFIIFSNVLIFYSAIFNYTILIIDKYELIILVIFNDLTSYFKNILIIFIFTFNYK